jgi:uncharacterized membrane protein
MTKTLDRVNQVVDFHKKATFPSRQQELVRVARVYIGDTESPSSIVLAKALVKDYLENTNNNQLYNVEATLVDNVLNALQPKMLTASE